MRKLSRSLVQKDNTSQMCWACETSSLSLLIGQPGLMSVHKHAQMRQGLYFLSMIHCLTQLYKLCFSTPSHQCTKEKYEVTSEDILIATEFEWMIDIHHFILYSRPTLMCLGDCNNDDKDWDIYTKRKSKAKQQIQSLRGKKKRDKSWNVVWDRLKNMALDAGLLLSHFIKNRNICSIVLLLIQTTMVHWYAFKKNQLHIV